MNSAPPRWEYLRALGYEAVAPQTINTPVKEPQASRFCAECLLGERQADVVLRLHDKLSSVLNVRNLEQAQQRGLALFWSHDLVRLSAFIESTR